MNHFKTTYPLFTWIDADKFTSSEFRTVLETIMTSTTASDLILTRDLTDPTTIQYTDKQDFTFTPFVKFAICDEDIKTIGPVIELIDDTSIELSTDCCNLKLQDSVACIEFAKAIADYYGKELILKGQDDEMMKHRNIRDTGSDTQGLSLLGSKETDYKYSYNPDALETFNNKHPENDYVVTFDGYEWTSVCPKTGQPDFAKIVISYIPNEKMVESKSLKLYLFSFRNHGAFHEDCMNIVLNDLVQLMNPKYIEVRGIFSPRGGIAIYPFVNYWNPAFPEYVDFARQRKLDILRDGSNRTVKYDV